jgi:hypothetical protein
MSVAAAEKKVKVPAREVQMAIGGLARESKTEICEETRGLHVRLTSS